MNINSSTNVKMIMSSAPGSFTDPVKHPSERQLDDDAKTRMDDEGGSVAPVPTVPGQPGQPGRRTA